MKRAEKILTVLGVIAVIMRYCSIAGGSILIVLSMLGLCCLYVLFGFALFNGIGFRQVWRQASYATLSAGNILYAIAAGIVAGMLAIGVLFCVQVWVGTEIVVTCSVLPGLVISIISLIKYVGKRSPLHGRVIARTLPLLLAEVVFVLIDTFLQH